MAALKAGTENPRKDTLIASEPYARKLRELFGTWTPSTDVPPAIQEVRVINIEGIDQQADGGTHVNNTSEVGRVRITKKENKGRINKRIEIVVES